MPGSARAYGRPGGAARTKGRGLGASEADAGAMLKEERAATLTQFLVTRLVMQGGEEADGTLVYLFIIIIYYSWNGGRAEAVCAGEKGVRMR